MNESLRCLVHKSALLEPYESACGKKIESKTRHFLPSGVRWVTCPECKKTKRYEEAVAKYMANKMLGKTTI
jgi:hypothetical protein